MVSEKKNIGNYISSQVSVSYTNFMLELRSSGSALTLWFFKKKKLTLFLKKPKFKKFLARTTGIWANEIGVDHSVCT